MQITGNEPHTLKPATRRARSARHFESWKFEWLRMWYEITRIPKEDLLILSIFGAVMIITIWLAARLL
jgi:hypothetical protein